MLGPASLRVWIVLRKNQKFTITPAKTGDGAQGKSLRLKPCGSFLGVDLSGTWIYEIKLDGYRALKSNCYPEIRRASKNYPALIEALKRLPAKGRPTRLL